MVNTQNETLLLLNVLGLSENSVKKLNTPGVRALLLLIIPGLRTLLIVNILGVRTLLVQNIQGLRTMLTVYME